MAQDAPEIIQDHIQPSPWRDDFPVLSTQMHGKPLAFLDSAASAQKPQAVIDAMNNVLTGGYSNIHRGLYEISQNLTQNFEDVRQKIANFISAQSAKNIVFTRNATEGINLIAQSWGRSFLQEGDEVILSEMEHHANIVPWQILRDQIGIVIKTIPVRDDFELDLDVFKQLLSDKTKLVGVVEISNSLGTHNPVASIIKIAKSYNPDIVTVIDGSQGIVHHDVDVTKMNCDFYVFTGHKLYAPSGIGGVYAKLDLLDKMPPYQGGGDMIERVRFDKTIYRDAPHKFEAGTPAIVEVIGLGAAVDYIQSIGWQRIEQHEKALAGYLSNQLQALSYINLYYAKNSRCVFPFTVDYAHTSDVAMILDQCGVAVRAGHHCCMPVMQRFGIEGTIRASIALYNNKEDVDQLIEGLDKAERMLR